MIASLKFDLLLYETNSSMIFWKDKCAVANCKSQLPTTDESQWVKGDGKSYLVEGLVLLIEDEIMNDNKQWKDYILSPYKKVDFKKGSCFPKCPQPTNWSSWSCWCPNDGPNTSNLPTCKCKEQTRKRIQACTQESVFIRFRCIITYAS